MGFSILFLICWCLYMCKSVILHINFVFQYLAEFSHVYNAFSVDSLGFFRYTVMAANTDNVSFIFPFFLLFPCLLPLGSNLLQRQTLVVMWYLFYPWHQGEYLWCFPIKYRAGYWAYFINLYWLVFSQKQSQ